MRRFALLALLSLAGPVAVTTGQPAEGPGLPAGGDAGVQGRAEPLTIGRLQYGGGGDWYANPTSLPNLLRAIREQTGIPTSDREVVLTPLDPRLRELVLVHMTGHGNVAFTPDERVALRRWLESGGFLHADDNYGMDEAFRREMAALFPEADLVEIPPDHPVYHVVNAFEEGLPKIHEHDGQPPGGYGIFLDGRLAVFYSHETDLGNGWEDPEVHDLPPDLREAALGMGVNLFVYALSRRRP